MTETLQDGPGVLAQALLQLTNETSTQPTKHQHTPPSELNIPQTHQSCAGGMTDATNPT